MPPRQVVVRSGNNVDNGQSLMLGIEQMLIVTTDVTMLMPDSMHLARVIMPRRENPFASLSQFPCPNLTSQQAEQRAARLQPLSSEWFWSIALEVPRQLWVHVLGTCLLGTCLLSHAHHRTRDASSAQPTWHSLSCTNGLPGQTPLVPPHRAGGNIFLCPQPLPPSPSRQRQASPSRELSLSDSHLLPPSLWHVFLRQPLALSLLSSPPHRQEVTWVTRFQMPTCSWGGFSPLPQVSPLIDFLFVGNSSPVYTKIAINSLSTQYQRCLFLNASLNSFSIPGSVSVSILQPNKDWNLFSVLLDFFSLSFKNIFREPKNWGTERASLVLISFMKTLKPQGVSRVLCTHGWGAQVRDC